MSKNYGVNLQKEIDEQSKDDWNFGAIKVKGIADKIAGLVTALFAWPAPIKGIYPRTMSSINHCVCSFKKKLAQYYPKGEVQKGIEDYMDCVTRGFLNEIEMELNYLVANKIVSEEVIAWFRIKGFFIDGQIVLSNRIPARGSKTTRHGNSLKAVIDWIKANGIHPRTMLPEDKKMTWNEYHRGFEMSQEVIDIGMESKDVIQINYAKVYYNMFLKFFGGFMWYIFDNYIDWTDGDYVKRLARDYNFLGYGYKLIINASDPQKIVTQEITTEQIRRVYMKRADLQKEFPAWNKFYSVTRPHYTIYDWARENGVGENPEIFNSPLNITWRWIKRIFSSIKGR